MSRTKTPKVKRIKAKALSLAQFLKSNPDTKLEVKGEEYIIQNPWGDSSMNLVINKKETKLLKALNFLILPPALNAVYHRKSKSLEFIFTIFPVKDDYITRKFTFNFNGKDYECKFDSSSEELMGIGKAFSQVGPSSTAFDRNLGPYNLYHSAPTKIRKRLTPTSFWITHVDWEKDNVVQLVQNLNFYMRYFDKESPMIVIHDETSSKEEKVAEVRYVVGDFPKNILAHPMNRYSLALWRAADDAVDPFMAFLYYYQVVEHASFYLLKEATANKLKRILLVPHSDISLRKSISEIIEVFSEESMHDVQKFEQLITRNVDPNILWGAIAPIKENFVKDIQLDGGFILSPIITDKTTINEFRTMGMQKVIHQIREIRNSIAHAKIIKDTKVIEPTKRNAALIKPWTRLMEVVASQIMICKSEM